MQMSAAAEPVHCADDVTELAARQQTTDAGSTASAAAAPRSWVRRITAAAVLSLCAGKS